MINGMVDAAAGTKTPIGQEMLRKNSQYGPINNSGGAVEYYGQMVKTDIYWMK